MTSTTTSTTKKAVNPFANKARPNVVSFVRECGGVFKYAAAIEHAFEEYFKQIGSPYERITTFASDFAIAECYGDYSVKDTYRRASSEWIDGYKFFTELAMVLNWYCWFWYDNGEPGLSSLYSDLYYKAKDTFYKHWRTKKTDSEAQKAYKEEAVSYFYETLD